MSATTSTETGATTSTETGTATGTSTGTGTGSGSRVRFNDPLFGEVMDFVWEEAALLDSDRQVEWLELVADDVLYTMPLRKTLQRKDGPGVDDRGGAFHDDKTALEMRVRRNVVIETAYDRDPPPRIRRLVSNVLVYRTDVEDELRVSSYIVLLRNQFQETGYDLLTAERQDVLRRTPDGLRLVRRTIIPDMSTFGAAYPNVLM
jgi:3-phenylpropionate/cinnamic acid dioxygenase small subunit